MLELHKGERTEAGARENIRVGVQYLAAWLGGKGAVPLYNLMEDAATAEICRTQLWQWLKFEAPLADGRSFTAELFEQLFDEEVGLLADVPNIGDASRLFHNMIVADDLVEFLTLRPTTSSTKLFARRARFDDQHVKVAGRPPIGVPYLILRWADLLHASLTEADEIAGFPLVHHQTEASDR